MWEGQGWKRTRRQLGFGSFIALIVIEAVWHVGLPIGVYSLTAGLLGLDLLDEAFDRLRSPSPEPPPRGKK